MGEWFRWVCQLSRCAALGVAGLIAAKPVAGGLSELSWFFWIVVFLSVWVIELSWFFWIVVFLSVWVIYTTSA